MVEVGFILALYLGGGLVILLALLFLLVFINQRAVEAEKQKKYTFEFVNGKYVAIKKKKPRQF